MTQKDTSSSYSIGFMIGYMARMGIVLLLIAGVASGILGFVNSKTAPLIKENKEKVERNARSAVLQEGQETIEIDFGSGPIEHDGFTYYIGKNVQGELLGYTFVAQQNGYSGVVRTMVGVTPDFKIKHIRVIEQTETPGLGAKAGLPDFPPRFEGLSASQLVVDKDGGNIASITGATITTRTITNSVRVGLERLVKTLENAPKPALDTPKEDSEDTGAVQIETQSATSEDTGVMLEGKED